jgi:hypothetical protein
MAAKNDPKSDRFMTGREALGWGRNCRLAGVFIFVLSRTASAPAEIPIPKAVADHR